MGASVPVFPYVLGPTYAGQLQPNATYTPTPGVPSATATTTPVGPPASATPVAPSPTPGAPPSATSGAPTATPGVPPPTATPNGPTATPRVPTATPIPACPTQFNDVDGAHPFYPYIQWMACRGYISGYPCGGPGEPCPGAYFRPGNMVTRGQLLKMVVNAAGWAISTPVMPTFADVAASDAFYPYIETGAGRGIISGYPCGGPGEPCVAPGNRPYFRPGNAITRGQLSKVIALARGYPLPSPPVATFGDVPVGSPFFGYVEAVDAQGIVSGYPCGGSGNPALGSISAPATRRRGGS